jgi:hypothetical protein
MKRVIFAATAIAAALCSFAADAAPSECFASPAAVFAAHRNATHASYTRRAKGPERCWYADAFRKEPEAKPEPKPEPQLRGPLATSAQPHTAAAASAPQPATTAVASAAQPRPAAMASAPQPRSAAVASAPSPRTTVVTSARPPLAFEFPAQIAPGIQMTPGSSRLLPADEAPADFEGRFSAYKERR